MDATKTQRRLTQNLIIYDGTEISLVREPPMVLDGAGGRIRKPNTAPKFFPPRRVFLSPVVGEQALVIDDMGNRRTISHILIDSWDADIKSGDHFSIGDSRYVVLSIYDDNSRAWQLKANVYKVT